MGKVGKEKVNKTVASEDTVENRGGGRREEER